MAISAVQNSDTGQKTAPKKGKLVVTIDDNFVDNFFTDDVNTQKRLFEGMQEEDRKSFLNKLGQLIGKKTEQRDEENYPLYEITDLAAHQKKVLALKTIEDLQNKEATNFLISLLKKPVDENTKAYIVRALGIIGDNSLYLRDLVIPAFKNFVKTELKNPSGVNEQKPLSLAAGWAYDNLRDWNVTGYEVDRITD